MFPLMRFRSIADRSCKLLRSFLVVLSAVGAEPQAFRFFGVLQIGQQPFIAEIEWLGILPIPVNDVVQTVNHFILVDLNREFTPAVEAARSQIEDPKQDEEKVDPLRPNQGSEQRDQLDDSRVRRFRSAISTTAHCSAGVTSSQLQPGRGRAPPPRNRPIEISRDCQSCNL
jgi:hypothetical protein